MIEDLLSKKMIPNNHLDYTENPLSWQEKMLFGLESLKSEKRF